MQLTHNAMRRSAADRLSRLGILEEPMGYVDGMSLYEYVGSSPEGNIDPLGTEHHGATQSPMPVRPPDIGIVGTIVPGGPQDNLATALSLFLFYNQSFTVVYPPESNVSKRFWESHPLLAPAREWYYHGANTLPKTDTYWSGWQTLSYTATVGDFIKDAIIFLGWNFGHEGVEHGGDLHIQQFGSCTLIYQSYIDCDKIGFRGTIYDTLTIESMFRNPITRNPIITRPNAAKVRIKVQIVQERTRN